MLDVIQSVKKNLCILKKLLPVFSFIIPFFLLYSLYPNSFEPVWTGTWKNRIYYIFFLWLFSLETILNWEELRTRKFELKSIRTIVFIIALLLPLVYVIIANYFGLNTLITDLAGQYNIEPAWAELMPLSTEYLVFAVFFALIIFLEHGSSGLKNYSISTCFLAILGAVYTLDNIYPFGEFTPFQIVVQPTAVLATNVLNLMGYRTFWLGTISGMPTFFACDPQERCSPAFSISWPCSGVESLLIYTVTILLFLKKSAIPLKHKTIYFIIGAIGTYFINILRIVTIFVIAINKGNWGIFHDYYGSLYSVAWIICYPLIIIGSREVWGRIRNWKKGVGDGHNLSNRPKLSD